MYDWLSFLLSWPKAIIYTNIKLNVLLINKHFYLKTHPYLKYLVHPLCFKYKTFLKFKIPTPQTKQIFKENTYITNNVNMIYTTVSTYITNNVNMIYINKYKWRLEYSVYVKPNIYKLEGFEQGLLITILIKHGRHIWRVRIGYRWE